MTPVEYLTLLGHTLAVVILVGSTVMMTFIVIPATHRGQVSAPAARLIGQRFSILTAIAGLAVLLTGIYLTSLQYTLTAIVTTSSVCLWSRHSCLGLHW